MARHYSPRRSSPWMAALVLAAILLLVVHLAPAAQPLPQQVAPGGNSSSTAQTNSTATNTTAPGGNTTAPGNGTAPVSNELQECAKTGVCTLPDRGKCFMLESTFTCPGFIGMSVPVNISDYFARRLPGYRAYLLPELKGHDDLDVLFSGNLSIPYAFMSRYPDQYMINLAGCTMPDQKWFKTWFCTDLLRHFFEAGDPCSKGLNVSICASTLDDRAASLSSDLQSSASCPIASQDRDKGNNHLKYLRNYPWRSASAPCISGAANEPEVASRQCGFASDFAACKSNACPALSSSCGAILQRKSTPTDLNGGASCDPVAVSCDPNRVSKTPIIVGCVVGVVALVGIGMLFRTRIRSKNVAQPGGNPTLLR